MTTSQKTSLKSVVCLEDVQLTPHQLGYMNARAKSHAHTSVLELFLQLSETDGLTRAFIARRLGKKPEQITRWLGAPGNWTLDTLSSLLAAMGYEPVFNVRKLSDLRNKNDHHPLASAPIQADRAQAAVPSLKYDAAKVYSTTRTAGQANSFNLTKVNFFKLTSMKRQISQ